MKIGGLRVDTQEVQGPFCRVAGIKEFPNLIYNGKFHGPSPRCGGPRRPGPPWTGGHCHTWELIGARPPAAPALESSDQGAGEGKDAQASSTTGMVRAKRRSAGGVGVFTEGGAAFYRAEARRRRPSALNGPH
jgi:hypothetical protein